MFLNDEHKHNRCRWQVTAGPISPRHLCTSPWAGGFNILRPVHWHVSVPVSCNVER